MTEDIHNYLKPFFFPHLVSRIDEIKDNSDIVLAHYTSADTAYKILDNKVVWMRNARLMNDYNEIRHGVALIERQFFSKNAKVESFWQKFEGFYPGIKDLAHDAFSSTKEDLENDTYLASFSEHSLEIDTLGKLSMWRAYGGQNGVAFLLDKARFLSEDPTMDAWVYPALYWKDTIADENITQIRKIIELNIEAFNNKKIPPETLIFYMGIMFLSLAVSLKHPAFYEEKEWRVIHRPNFQIVENDAISKITKVLSGTQQHIYQIPLDEKYMTSVPEVIVKMLIGPSSNPIQVSGDISEILKKRGIEEPETIIEQTNIPLRF